MFPNVSGRKKPRIVIVGANFAGLSAAARFSRKYDVTVIDPKPEFEFMPNLHEIISGIKDPELLKFNKQDCLARMGHRFLMETVDMIDPVSRLILTQTGRQLNYDVCIISIGGAWEKEGNSFAVGVNSISDAVDIRNRLDTIVDSKTRKSIMVVGGGITGIEVLGELLRRCTNHDHIEFHLVEKEKRLLSRLPAVMDREIRTLCKPYPITIHTDTSVQKMNRNSVTFANGHRQKTDLVIWASGNKVPNLLNKANLVQQPGGFADVSQNLQSRVAETVFIAGDASQFPVPIEKQAYHAIDMGSLAADNVKRFLNNQPLLDFTPSGKPMIVTFGEINTFVVVKEWVLAGKSLAILKEGVYHYVMARFDPAIRLKSMLGLYRRTRSSLENLLFPEMLSLAKLKQLPDIRLLR